MELAACNLIPIPTVTTNWHVWVHDGNDGNNGNGTHRPGSRRTGLTPRVGVP